MSSEVMSRVAQALGCPYGTAGCKRRSLSGFSTVIHAAGSATDLVTWIGKQHSPLGSNDPVGHHCDQALKRLRRPVDQQHASALVNHADPFDGTDPGNVSGRLGALTPIPKYETSDDPSLREQAVALKLRFETERLCRSEYRPGDRIRANLVTPHGQQVSPHGKQPRSSARDRRTGHRGAAHGCVSARYGGHDANAWPYEIQRRPHVGKGGDEVVAIGAERRLYVSRFDRTAWESANAAERGHGDGKGVRCREADGAALVVARGYDAQAALCPGVGDRRDGGRIWSTPAQAHVYQVTMVRNCGVD